MAKDEIIWYDRTPLLTRMLVWVWQWNNDRAGQRPLVGRLTAHVALATIVGLFFIVGRVQFDAIAFASANPSTRPTIGHNQNASLLASTRRYGRSTALTQVVRRAEMHTAIPVRPRLEIVTYVVQVGDTAESIAKRFGLQPTTLLWSNPEMERTPDLLRPGQVLTILPLDGVYHTVQDGDTLESLADTYKVSIEAIKDCPFNTIPDNGDLASGTKLIIPGGTKPHQLRTVTMYSGPVPDDANGTGIFRWPTSGVLTQGYWYGHRAIDIGAPLGTAILASDGGYVAFEGWTDVGYGYLIIIDHNNGYRTYYAHLSNIFVTEGEAVKAGQVIGAMGSTGNSTGPHLHFEIRYNGYQTNPLIYLP